MLVMDMLGLFMRSLQVESEMLNSRARVGIDVPWHRLRQTAAARSSLASTCPGIEFSREEMASVLSPPYISLNESTAFARLGCTRAMAALTHSGQAGDFKPWVHEMIQLPKP